jgi:hypothetical protein
MRTITQTPVLIFLDYPKHRFLLDLFFVIIFVYMFQNAFRKPGLFNI